MHGVPGHDGVPPSELLETVRGELAGYGCEFRSGEVETVSDGGSYVRVRLRGGDELTARVVIAATGLTDELPEIPGIAGLWGSRLLHCPYCHGWEVRDQRLGVIAVSPMSLHQVQIVRQWSDRIAAFMADLGPIEPEVEAQLRPRISAMWAVISASRRTGSGPSPRTTPRWSTTIA